MNMEKVFLDSEAQKEVDNNRVRCQACERQGLENYFRFFMINPDTEIFKCESSKCFFLPTNHIFRNISNGRCFTTTNPTSSSGRTSDHTPSQPVYHTLRPVHDSTMDGNYIEDSINIFFPEETFPASPSKATLYTPQSISAPAEQLKVPLPPSMIKNIEEKRYKCISCDRFNLTNYLRFFIINEHTEILKCESPKCMFPNSNYVFRDRRDQTYYRKPSSQSTDTTGYSPRDSMIEFNVPDHNIHTDQGISSSSKIVDILNELFPEEDDLPGASTTFNSPEKPMPQWMDRKEHFSPPPPKVLIKTIEIISQKKAPARLVTPKNIKSPLDLVNQLLKRRQPLSDEDFESSVILGNDLIRKVPLLTNIKRTSNKVKIVSKPKVKAPPVADEMIPVATGEDPGELPSLDAEEVVVATSVKRRRKSPIKIKINNEAPSAPSDDPILMKNRQKKPPVPKKSKRAPPKKSKKVVPQIATRQSTRIRKAK